MKNVKRTTHTKDKDIMENDRKDNSRLDGQHAMVEQTENITYYGGAGWTNYNTNQYNEAEDITEDIIENKITMDGWTDENTMKDHLTKEHLTEDIIENIIENKEHTTMNGKSIQDNTTEDHVTMDTVENIVENKITLEGRMDET